jgi:hypothetical protein
MRLFHQPVALLSRTRDIVKRLAAAVAASPESSANAYSEPFAGIPA